MKTYSVAEIAKLLNVNDKHIIPIIDNKVLFTIDNEIMNQIDEIGQYHVHIRIYDDRGNRIKLPYFIMRVEESEIDDDDIPIGSTDTSAIDNSKVYKYGKELRTFNKDGSYNRTIWIAGDIITDSKLNKIEFDGIDDMICLGE